ncbi:MAG TPA: ABC transporter substrate-binding protein [Candidatus Cybelea sp.]|nr:ABC transporter substrate-binding protein [Candidatus Cybelea sp.]
MRWTIASIGRLGLAAAALTVISGAAIAQDIKIGIPTPVTGPVAFLGQHVKWGAELAVEEINGQGGVNGRKIAAMVQDSVCRPADSVAAAEKLLSEDKVDVLFGDICSGATLALMPIAERAGKPMIVAVSTHPDITQKAGVGGNKWVFRTVPDDILMSGVIADRLLKQGAKTIAFVAEDTDYGRGGVKFVTDKLGGKVQVISADYLKNSETDFLPVLTRLRSAKPDAIGIFMLDQQVSNFMKQYVQFGMTVPLVARPPLVSGLVADLLATGKFNGSWTVYPYYDGYDGAKNVAFVDAFKAHFKQGPHYVAYSTYEAIKMAADAVKRAGSTDPAALQKALAATNYQGILGPIKFDDHNQAHNNLMFMQVQDGKLMVKELLGS